MYENFKSTATYEIKTWRDPYDAGFSICKKRKIELQEGLTVLVGCNGAGKSTLLSNIKEVIKKDNIPCFYYDNLSDGGTNSISEAYYRGDYDLMGGLWLSSEGETISLNLGNLLSRMQNFLKTGETRHTKEIALAEAFGHKTEQVNTNKRFLLMDAVDSGYSVDNVIELKKLFQIIMEDAKKMGLELYIVISANEYELVYENDCLDVMEGKYRHFKTYNSYRNFILLSKKRKDIRIQKAQRKRER